MDRCPTCGEWDYGPGPHRCPTAWLVWCVDWDEDVYNVTPTYAWTPEEAAEKWAEEDDAGGDYTIIGGTEVTVCVARQKDYDAIMLDKGDALDDDGREPPQGVERQAVRGVGRVGAAVPRAGGARCLIGCTGSSNWSTSTVRRSARACSWKPCGSSTLSSTWTRGSNGLSAPCSAVRCRRSVEVQMQRDLPDGVQSALDAMADRNEWAAKWSKAVHKVAKAKMGVPSCFGCTVGGCCQQPILVTYLDAIPIAVRLDRLGMNDPALRDAYRVNGEEMERVTAAGSEGTYKGQCPFLAGAHECTVYADRPMICRVYWVFQGQRQCVPPARGGPVSKVCTLDHSEATGRMIQMAMEGAVDMGYSQAPYIRGIGVAVAVVLEALAGPADRFWHTVVTGSRMPAERFAQMLATQDAAMPEREVL